MIFIFHPSDRVDVVDVVGVLSVFCRCFVFFFSFFLFLFKICNFSSLSKRKPPKKKAFFSSHCKLRRGASEGEDRKVFVFKKKTGGGGRCEGTSFSSLFSKKRSRLLLLILVLGSKFDFFLFLSFSLFSIRSGGKNDGVVKPNHVFLCSYFS